MAYVQAFLDDNPVTQGLAKLRGKLKAFQASLSSVAGGAMGGELPEPLAAIARFAASPAGAFAALLGAAKYTAEAREEMFKMSEVTGVAVDKLSALSYAARRAGVSNEALGNALKKMQGKEFQALMQGMGGGKHGAGGMKALMAGVAGQIAHGDAADQLRSFIKLTENMPTAERIGLAKRLGLDEVLPLISQGIEYLDAFTARAKELGLVMSEDDAKAGKRFEMAFGDLTDVLKSSVAAIGGALIPLVTGLTNAVVRVVASVRDWLKEHQQLTQALFYGTGAIVAGGIALKLFSVGLGMVSQVIGVAQLAVKGLSFAFGVLSTVVSWLPLLANPFVLMGVAIAGVIGYLGYASGAFDGMGKQWAGFVDETKSSIGAISNAISKGNFQAAWNVVTAYFSTEWQRLINTLQDIWEGFRSYFTDAYYGMLSGWNNVTSSMKGAWQNMLAAMKSAWASWKEGVGDFYLLLEGKLTGQDQSGAYAALADDMQRERDNASRSRDQGIRQIKEEQRAEEARLGAANNAAAAARAARQKEREDRLKSAQDALAAAQAAANAPGADLLGGKHGAGGLSAMQQSTVAGTFSGIAAALLGGGGGDNAIALQKQANAIAADDAANSAKWRSENGDLGPKLKAIFDELKGMAVQ